MIQELADHLLRRIKDFHTHRSLRLDTAVTENILIQGRLLKMCQIGKGHPAELEHQSGNGLCTSQTVRLGILIQKLMQFLEPATRVSAECPLRSYTSETVGGHTELSPTPLHDYKHYATYAYR